MTQKADDTLSRSAPPDRSPACSADKHESRDGPLANTQGPVIDSQQILQGAREVTIWHNHERYRLIVTRNNKLILQK